MDDGSLLAFLCGGLFASIGVTYCLFRDRYLEPELVPVRRVAAPRGVGPELTRRALGRAAVGLLVVGVGAALAPRRAVAAELVTEIPANAPTLRAVGYVERSAKPGQQCGNCVLYQPGADGRGKCGLFAQGLVAEQGWCSSWVGKPS